MKHAAFDAFQSILEALIKYAKWIVIASLALLVLSGFYRVESNEVAVVLRFGRLVGVTQEQTVKTPGLHFALPFFIDEVVKIPVQTIHERTVETHYGGGGNVSPEVNQSGYLLTGDRNIILLRAKVKYQIENPAAYALYSKNPGDAIDGIVSAELTAAVTGMTIDGILTSEKAGLSQRILQVSQEVLSALETGIVLTGVELTELVPPAETREYFDAVVNAAVNKETSMQEAREYATGTLLDAETLAAQYLQLALSEQSARLIVARNELAQFDGLYEQYTKDPGIIINGNFRARVSAVLSSMGGTVIIPENGTPPVIVLP